MPDPAFDAARRELGLSVLDLWIRYFALGGSLDATAVGVYLEGGTSIGDNEHDVLAHALNEAYTAQGQNHPLAYRHHRGSSGTS
jgi:hypothetical protein